VPTTRSNHKAVGTFCLVVALVFLVAGGVLGAVLRTQLAQPDEHLLGARAYRELLSLHGTFSVFLFLMPAWVGLGFAVVPLQVGARRLAFPRLAVLSASLFLAGGGVLVAAAISWDHGAPQSWALDPSSFAPHRFGHAPELWLMGLAVVGVAVISGSVNIVTTALTGRSADVAWDDVPLFTRSMVVSSAVLLLAVPVLLAGLALLYLQHHSAGRAFDDTRGGDPLVWHQLFWFFAYPALWALVIPALGAVSEIVDSSSPARGKRSREMGLAIAAVGVFAFTGWGSELVVDTSVPKPLFVVGGLLTVAAAGAVVLTWLDVLRRGRPALKLPGVHALVLILLFAVGLGGTAVMRALPLSRAGVLTYWWVASWHALLVGGATLGVVTALCYWAPSLWGRYLSGGLGALQLLLIGGGAVLMVAPMFVLGGQLMQRSTVAYSSGDGWTAANLISTVGSYLLAAGILVLVVNLLSVAAGRTRSAPASDPWELAAAEAVS
jgi:cytochrome c oxidase subunit I+III